MLDGGGAGAGLVAVEELAIPILNNASREPASLPPFHLNSLWHSLRVREFFDFISVCYKEPGIIGATATLAWSSIMSCVRPTLHPQAASKEQE